LAIEILPDARSGAFVCLGCKLCASSCVKFLQFMQQSHHFSLTFTNLLNLEFFSSKTGIYFSCTDSKIHFVA